MNKDQIDALMAIRRAKSRREVSSRMYMRAPSGPLGIISSSCREVLATAMREEQDAREHALAIGVDPELMP